MSGASNAQKQPLGQSLNKFARQKAQDQIQQTGRSLPCSVVKIMGSIVTVNFEIHDQVMTIPNVTIPIIGSEYIRLPIQVGCKGLTVAADAYLGGMSGLGGGVASLTSPFNLTALAFVPLGNTAFSAADANTLTLYGNPGVLMRTQANDASISMTSGQISMTAGGHTIVISSSGVVIDGRVFLLHDHSGVTTGTGVTGPVV
jgi:hypothetical protein